MRPLIHALLLAGLTVLRPVAVQAQFAYTVNESTVTITGYDGPGGAVAIPSEIDGLPVRTIGGYAFYSRTNLTSVTLPDSVTTIEGGAFASCTGVTNVSMTNSITAIGYFAFQGCTSLPQITLPENLGILGEQAFAYCSNLVSVTLPDSITNLGVLTFAHCISLPSASIPSKVKSIRVGQFYGCTSLTNIHIPESVTRIQEQAFYGCARLARVTIPNSVTEIDQGAFAFCTSLTNITLPTDLSYLGYATFSGCTNLTRITIPSGVTDMGFATFNGCVSLTSAYFLGDAPDPGFFVFSGGMNTTVYHLPGTSGWEAAFAGLPTALWTPQIQTGAWNLGAPADPFGFRIEWAKGMVVVIQASTNLSQPLWVSLQTNILADGSFDFSDPECTNRPARFYRAAVKATGPVFIPAASGTITPPFTITDNYISQPVETTGNKGGSAAYDFVVTDAGNYLIQTIVNAPDGGANSFFVNIDAEPKRTSMIWDIPVTRGFEQRAVSWRGKRGSGSETPKFFHLGQGTHQLIVRGREAGAQLQSFTIVPAP